MATPTTASKEAPPQNAAKGAEIKYEYMFRKDKSPTEQLDALLRAIARHIALEIGDKKEYSLTPAKLAAFYKAVGGDYDALFVQNEHKSISWMWQITGCQHSLNPTDDDFAPPSIPALTPRGFCRWESLEILLGPDEHVPFLQYAVKHFNLKHPETGAPFPPNLPRTVFPQEPDPDVDRWHKHCAAQLNEAAAKEGATDDQTSPEPKAGRTKPAPERPEFTEPKYAYVHVNHSNSSSERQHARPGAQRARPFTYSHVPGRSANTPGVRVSARSPQREHREPPPDDRDRRKSFSDYPSPSQERTPGSSHSNTYSSGPFLDPNAKRPTTGSRRHSHPRPYDTDESESEAQPVHQARRRQASPQPGRKYPPPSSTSIRPSRSQRVETQSNGLKRHSNNSPLGSLRGRISEKVSGVFGSSRPTERPKTDSRQNSYADSPRPRRSPQRPPLASRAQRAGFSDIDSEETSEPESSGEDLRRRRRKDERVRDGYKARPPPYELDRELDDDVDSGGRRYRPSIRRPEVYRRTSSHADIDRRRDQAGFDPRGRDRFRDDRRRYDRRSPNEGGSTSPMTGVTGRRYPAEPVYT